MKLSVLSKPFKIPFSLRFPTDGGAYVAKFTAECKFMTDSQNEAMQEEINKKFPGTDDEAVKNRLHATIDAAVIGLHGFENEDGTPMDPKAGLELAKKDYSWIVNALFEARNETFKNARVKN